MPNKKILIAILLIAVITIGILVPTLILIGGPGADKTPPTIQIKSPMSATYFTQNTQVTINLSSPDKNADAFWYRIYNETGSRWVDPTNITWISSCQRTLTNGGIYTLYAWVNDTLGRVSSMKNVTFTVYELIIYSGNHTFSSDLTMKLYQKVILQNGEFAFSSGALYVSGILAMYNVTWTSDLKINGSSAVIYGNNVTFNGVADIYGTLNTSLKDTHFFALDLFDNSYCTLIDAFFTGSPSLFDNSNLNITDAVINGGLLVVNSAILRVANSTLASVSTGAFAKANLSQCTIGGVYETDFSVVTLKNCDVAVVTLRGNLSLSLINSSADQIYRYLDLNTGNLNINHNVISGTGTYIEPKLSTTNSIVDNYYTDLAVRNSANVSFNNSAYYVVRTFNSANITLHNSTIQYIYVSDYSGLSAINTTIASDLDLQTNGTIYLTNVSVNEIVHGFSFYNGDIYGYNATFVGAEVWMFPKITLGPNVVYSSYRYRYHIYNQVNFTLVNTSQVYSIYAWDSANISLFSCNMPFVQIFCYSDSNITIYFSILNTLSGFNTGNYTLINTTCNLVVLQQSSFARVVTWSHIRTLTLYDSAWYYKSPESVIDIINKS